MLIGHQFTIGSGSFENYYERANILASQQRFDDAIEAYRNALTVRPLDLEAHLNLGLVLQAADRCDEAIACYEAAVAIAPGFAETQIRLGGALSQKGEMTAAVVALRRAIALDPFAARPQMQLAQTLRNLGDLSGAETSFRCALELEPEHVEARAYFSMLLQQTGKEKEAEVLLDYPLLLRTRQLEHVDGWPADEAFNDDLAQCVLHHPTLTRDVRATATRGGSQTLEILDSREGPILALKRFIDESVTAYLQTVSQDAKHIFVTPPPATWLLRGWAVLLRSGGHQLPHFHPAAFISGVYYLRVPEVVKTCGVTEAGFLKFGHPTDGTRHEDVQVARLNCSIRPEEGMIVLFPSYFWHYTVPFESDEERISIAFDVIRPVVNVDPIP